MDFEKEYKEAFKRAERRFDPNPADGYAGYANGIIEDIFPQFTKREDERTRKEILDFIKSFWADHKESIPRISSWLAWLEKQKECVADSSKTSADEDERIRKKLIEIIGYFISRGIDQQLCEEFLAYLEKKKEPHYTKRNVLFDKCVENCDPKTVEEVNKRVDDIMNMSELSAFEQALTNFIGYWEDDEERWPSKFVKTHGKHILDMAKEELQKEQKHPNGCFTCDEYKKGYEEGRRNGFTAGYNKAMKEVEQKEQKPAEWSEDIIRKAVKEIGLTQHQIDWFKDNVFPSKVEWSEEDEDKLYRIIETLLADKEVARRENQQHYDVLCKAYDELIAWLKSLRPQGSKDSLQTHWKPSEEQMSAFKGYIEDFQARAEAAVGGWNNFDVMIRLYEQLKSL